MARQTKIISFSDAKTRSRRVPASGASASRGRKFTGDDYERAYAMAASVHERRRAAEAAAEEDAGRDAAEEERTRATMSARDRRKRERAKARADKMFAKQFGDDASASAGQSEGAPRAAVYQGKMGSRQRKSARMQSVSSAGSSSAKIDPRGWFASIPFSIRTLKVATAAICIVLAVGFLYTPAQQYYLAQREHDRLAAEYSIIEERNEVLDAQNDALASDAGMEQAVRQKYGYVKQGEKVDVVTGLSEEAANSSQVAGQVEPAVLSSSVKAPEYWYTPLLDAFFGVE